MGNLFNFYVRMIDGNFIPCNVDNFKFFFRLLHAYAFESTNPELMGAIVHRVAPDQIFLNTPTCASEGVPTPQVVNMQTRRDRARTAALTPIGPTNALRRPAGLSRRHRARSEPAEHGWHDPVLQRRTAHHRPPPTVRIYVERVGGTLGIASAQVSTADGTASAGTEYTNSSATLTWADGQAGRQYLDIPITASPPAPAPSSPTPLNFTVARTSATGAVWAGATSVTLEIEAIG